MSFLKKIALLAAVSLQSSCVLITDAATRLAYDLEAGAMKLDASSENELEVRHQPIAFPAGVGGDYFVWLQPTSGRRSLAVGDVGGKRYGTTYHLNFMTVPNELIIRKEAGEPTYLTLRKTGLPNDGELGGKKSVEVISIR